MPCVLCAATAGFGGRALGHGQLPGNLVTKPLVLMDDLTGKNGALSCHQEKAYHKRSVLDMQDFDSVFVRAGSIPQLVRYFLIPKLCSILDSRYLRCF